MKNKYYQILEKILKKGKVQNNMKGNIKYLLDEQLKLYSSDLLEIFEGHQIARNKLKTELQLFQGGERLTEKQASVGGITADLCW